MKYDRHSWAHRSISDENTLHKLTSPHLRCVQSTRDKWPISNVPFVWRFCCIVNISLFHLSEYRLELEEQLHAWVKSKFNGVGICIIKEMSCHELKAITAVQCRSCKMNDFYCDFVHYLFVHKSQGHFTGSFTEYSNHTGSVHLLST